jgi:EpsI family protein
MRKKIKNRYLFLIAVSAILALPVNFLQYDLYAQKDRSLKAITGIPLNLGRWAGRDIQLEPQVYALLETRSIIHRNYFRDGRQVLLSIVYYPDTRVSFHAPEACLGARGVELMRHSRQVYLNNNIILSVNQLLYRQGNSSELVYYFYKAGSYCGDSYLSLRLNIAFNKLNSGNKSGSLIRISTPIMESSTERAQQTLRDFLAAVYPFVSRSL